MDAAAFPIPTAPGEKNVGFCEGLPTFVMQSDLPDGSEVVWQLNRVEQRADGLTQEKRVCAYPGVVKDGAVQAHIPVHYARWLEQGTARLRLIKSGAA
jgi:hypothetical protein